MSTTGAKDRFKRAEQAANKGNYEYAIELYLQGLTLDPKACVRRRLHDVEALAIEEKGGNPEGGVGTTMKAMGIIGKAKKLKVQKKWDEAVPEIERAIRLQPRNANLLVELAEVLEQIEAKDSALEVLEEVVSYDTRNIEGLRRIARILGERDTKDDIEKAIEYWEKLKMISPSDKEANKAVRDLSAANMVKQAEERRKEGDGSFKDMLKSEEEAANLEQAGKVIRTDEDRKAAIVQKKAQLKEDPSNSRLWRELGTLFQDLRDWKHALAAYKKAIEVNPHDMFAKDKIGKLREDRMVMSLEALRKKADVAEQNGGGQEQLQGQLVEAEKKYLEFRINEYGRRTLEHPTDYELKIQYGQVLMEAERFDEAISEFQKAIKDPKLKTRSQFYMGQCFQQKGVAGLAVKQYREALGGIGDPDSEIGKDIRYSLAVASVESGDKKTALEVFEELMAIDIGYRDVSSRVDTLMKSDD